MYHIPKGRLFPVADLRAVPALTRGEGITVRAEAIGEFREPRRGEWFLSGAYVEAYYASNDLAQPFDIARLVRVQRVVEDRVLGPVAV